MKFIAIFALILMTCLSNGLKSSHHYKFDYFSNFKTGIPYDGNQASGVSFKAVLDVYLEDKDGFAIFKLSDLKSVVFEEDLGCDQDVEFDEDRFQPPKDKVFSTALEKPFRVNLRGSQPFSIEYEGTDLLWLPNLQKGIASIFKNEILKGNFETEDEENSVSSFFHEGHLLNSFSVDEETIFGICKANYEIHQIKDHLPTRNNETLWSVERFLDFDKCKDKVILNVHTTNEKRNKDEKLRYTRSSVSTYVLRGSPGHFDLGSAIVEGVVSFPVSLFDEHEISQATTKQKLFLIAETTNDELPKLGTNLKQSTTWMHQFLSSFILPKDSKPLPWIVYPNENHYNQGTEMYGAQSFNSDEITSIKASILEMIEKASDILTEINPEQELSFLGNVPDLLNYASYYMKILPKADILDLFDKIFEKNVKIQKRLIIDITAVSGTLNAYDAILDYILADKLEPYQIRDTFKSLASSEGTLNITRFMDYILEKMPKSKFESSVVLLNFAHYLSEFCIHKAHNYNPVKELFKEECVLTAQKFLPFLKSIIYNENYTFQRGFAIKVLEYLRSSFNFDILSPLIDGRMKSSIQLRAMALRALKNWAPDHDRKESVFRKPVMDLLKDVYTDVYQDFEVRTSALVSYISWQPSTSFWYDLAKSTWHEPSRDFSSFTSNLIKLYAEERVPALEKQWKDASFALEFAKATMEEDYTSTSLFDVFFKNYAKFNMLSMKEEHSYYVANFLLEIFSKVNGFNLLKLEKINLHTDDIYSINASKRIAMKSDNLPLAKEFFEKFSKEIHLQEYVNLDQPYFQLFFQIFGGGPDTVSGQQTYHPLKFDIDAEDENVSYGGRYLNFFEKTDSFPNELGLPAFTFSSLPSTYSVTTKSLPKVSGQVYSNQFIVRGSSVYSRGVGVFLPWNLQSYCAFVRSSVELVLPIGHRQKRHVGTEGPLRVTKVFYDIPIKKKFPVFRVSNSPITTPFKMDTSIWNPEAKVQIIKKHDVKERVISEVHPLTGIKYDISMNADTKTDVSLHDFQLFPRIPFKLWNFAFYLNSEESETKEVLHIISQGTLKKSKGNTEETPDKIQENPTISNTDSEYERSEKVTREFGGDVSYTEFKFILLGEKERSFDFFFAEREKSEKETRKLIGFTASRIPGIIKQPQSFCIDYFKEGPLQREEDVAFITKQNITQDIKLKFLFNCSDPILKAHALYSMSDEGKVETTENCNIKYNNADFNPNYKLYYDTAEIDVSYKKDIESYDFVILRDVFESLKNFIDFPSIKKLTHETRDGKVEFRIQRNTYHKNWDLFLKTSSGDAFLATFSDTSLFKYLSGISNFVPSNVIDAVFVVQGSSDNKCTLEGNTVTTFDGVHYSYQPSECWTLGFHSNAYWSTWFRAEANNVFLIRTSQKTLKIPDFKYILFNLYLEIEFSNDELKVNGTVVDRISENSPDLKEIEADIIYKIGHRYLIYGRERQGMPTVIVSPEKIEIYTEKSGSFSGICGNNDGRIYPEFVGPKNCVFNDGKMFTKSWTGQSDTCDDATLQEYRKGIDDFQANCKSYQPNYEDFHLNERCLFFGWKIITKENNYCISTKPLPFCLDTCNIKETQNIKVTYKCWPKEKAPEHLRTSIEKKEEIFTYPVNLNPYSYEHYYTEIATLCKKY